jgi:hypothetical protein
MTRKERVSTISCGVASLHIAWAMTYGEWCPQLGRSGFLRRTLPHRLPVSLGALSCFDGFDEWLRRSQAAA